jgi:DNA-binding CsgD family transcriptional regulator
MLNGLAAACLAVGQVPSPLLEDTLSFFETEPSTKGQGPIDILQIAHALEEVATIGPVALFLDDLQWSPHEGTELLLGALKLSETPALLLTTQRASANDDGKTSLRIAADLPSDRLVISGLTENSVSELAARTLMAPALPSLARELHARTDGNPLFVLETLREWQSTGEIIRQVGGYWGFARPGIHPQPKALTQVLIARLMDLTDRPLEIARKLAILGRAASLEELDLSSAAELDRTLIVLSELEDAGVAIRNMRTGTYELRHPLYQDALLSAMNETLRAAHHGHILEALRECGTAINAAELAYHGIRSLRTPDDLSELLYAAAKQAEKAGEYANSADWYEALAQRARDDSDLRDALAGKAAALEYFDPGKSVESYDRAIALTPVASERRELFLGRARAYRRWERPGETLQDLERARTCDPDAQMDQIDLDVALVRAIMGQIVDAEVIFRRLSVESADALVRTQALAILGMVASIKGQSREGLRLTREASLGQSNFYLSRYMRNNEIWFLVFLGEWDEASSLLAGAIAEARHGHDLWHLTALTQTLAMLEAWRGNFGESIDLATQVLTIAESIGKVMDVVSGLGCLGMALLEQGRYGEAAKTMDPIPELIDSSLEKNHVQQALVNLGEARLMLGDIEGAQALLSRAEEYLSFNQGMKICIDRLAAQVALTMGDPARALAVGSPWLLSPSEFRFEQGRLHEVLARAHHALGQRDSALGEAHAAREIFADLGARVRLASVMDLIATLTPRKAGRPRSKGQANLTSRELEIVKLVGCGSTNSEIADSLFISTGTVKKHVENIKRKVGVRRRSELAVFATSSLVNGGEAQAQLPESAFVRPLK